MVEALQVQRVPEFLPDRKAIPRAASHGLAADGRPPSDLFWSWRTINESRRARTTRARRTAEPAIAAKKIGPVTGTGPQEGASGASNDDDGRRPQERGQPPETVRSVQARLGILMIFFWMAYWTS